MKQITADFIIIGGGIAGASAGYELSKHGKVVLLEKESQPGYHTTGRSAAIFQKGYGEGDPVIHALVEASEEFLRQPPEGFTNSPILSPRALVYITSQDQSAAIHDLFQDLSNIDVNVEMIDAQRLAQLFPVISDNFKGPAIFEHGAADIDVAALHDGFLRGIRDRGSEIYSNAEVTHLSKEGGFWHVTTPTGKFSTPLIINAAGAWVDEIAQLANISPIHILPLRRTMILVPPPKESRNELQHEGSPIQDWPFVMDAKDGFYFKPDSGKILATPADKELCPPCDVQPEEINIAFGAHYLESATVIKVTKIDHSWAGLRNHVADEHPVVGFDPEADGFFWLAGQGGFGIKTSPAMGRITASLILGDGLPKDLTDLGLTEQDISVNRIKKIK